VTSAIPARTVPVPAGVRIHQVSMFAETEERYEQIVAEHDANRLDYLDEAGELHRWAEWGIDGVPYVLYPPVRVGEPA